MDTLKQKSNLSPNPNFSKFFQQKPPCLFLDLEELNQNPVYG
jgi:hypothetical protein